MRFSTSGNRAYYVDGNVFRPLAFAMRQEPVIEPPEALRPHELARLGFGRNAENNQRNGRETIIPPPPKPSLTPEE